VTRTEKLLAELIALPSVNPAFMPPRHPYAGEKNAADFLAATAAAAGLEVEFQTIFPSRSNVIARLLPAGTIRQSVLLAPHLDTVGADVQQFIPQRRNGRLYGRGACDTKGSVAAMLAALMELTASPKRPRHTEIIFAGLIDEENAQAGSRALVKDGFKAQLAIVGEPTGNRIVTAHKGCLWLNLSTTGRAAHGAMPHLGKNAVHEMARVVELLETTYAARLKKRRHKLLGHGTVNVGKISGGTQPNIVPDSCVIEIDRRTLPGETENSVRREIAALLATRKIRARISSFKDAPAFPLETDPKLPLVSGFLQTARQSKPLGVDYFCDASVLAAGGIPSVVFGPGNIAHAHTSDEWISLGELEQAKDMLVAFLKTLP
jgi:acetylornithine deacetylase/succinyl-diaminopimelate desuccinylase-like protein